MTAKVQGREMAKEMEMGKVAVSSAGESLVVVSSAAGSKVWGMQR